MTLEEAMDEIFGHGFVFTLRPKKALEALKVIRKTLLDYKQLKSDYIELDNRLRTANTEIDRLQSVSSWIPCKERMPENAGKPGAFCAKHLIMTKFGITEGWFNPDFDCWFALVWFYTSRFLDEEISMERADVPKVCRLPKSCVTHWRCFPDSPHGGGTYEKD